MSNFKLKEVISGLEKSRITAYIEDMLKDKGASKDVFEEVVSALFNNNLFALGVEYFSRAVKAFPEIALENYFNIVQNLVNFKEQELIEKVLLLARENFPDNPKVYEVLRDYYSKISDVVRADALLPAYFKALTGVSVLTLGADELRKIPENFRLAMFGHLGLCHIFYNFLVKVRPDIKISFAMSMDWMNTDVDKNPGDDFSVVSTDCFALNRDRVDGILTVGAGLTHAAQMSISLCSRLGKDTLAGKNLYIVGGTVSSGAEAQTVFRKYCLARPVLGELYRDALNLSTEAGEEWDFAAYSKKLSENTTDISKLLRERFYPLQVHFIQRMQKYVAEKGAHFICLTSVNSTSLPPQTEFEKILQREPSPDETGFKSCKDVLPAIYEGITAEPVAYLNELYRLYYNELTIRATVNGPMMNDFSSEYFNIHNGQRIVPDSSDAAEHTVYFMGNSRCLGYLVEDAHTTANFMQRLLNADCNLQKQYRVVNASTTGIISYEILHMIKNIIDIREGDVVIVYGPHKSDLNTEFNIHGMDVSLLESSGVNHLFCDFSSRKPGEDVFVKHSHYNHNGSRIIAEELFKRIFGGESPLVEREARAGADTLVPASEEICRDADFVADGYRDYLITEVARRYNSSAGMNEFLMSLGRMELEAGSVGSIVMNCNPFTKGHLGLITYAAGKVDNLVIFVLEEDRSFFPFADRMELVRAGVAHLPNVRVLPSGSCIISNETFPEYFKKESRTDDKIDATHDLTIFADCIAPALGITTRFVGMEPFCKITRQYNEQMKFLLPKYGIEVVEIERFEEGGEAVSASKVRRLLKDKDFAGIAEIVPETTLEYLRKRFG